MNLFSSRRGLLNLEKILKSSENTKYNPNKSITEYETKDKKGKGYSLTESRFNFKQILKHYKLNRQSQLNGFTRKYINLLTELLYENDHENYASKRLSLVNFRKNIIKKNINISYEQFLGKVPRNNNLKKDSIYITDINNKLYNLKQNEKSKNFFNNKIKKNKTKNEISTIDFLKKVNLRLNFDTIPSRNKNTFKIKSLSLENTPINQIKINEKNKLKTVKSYTYKINDEYKEYKKYMWNMNPEEELVENNNKLKFVDYLNNKYDFYNYKTLQHKKNIKEFRKRQILFNKDRFTIYKKVDFPYKKEFFTKFSRLNLKNINSVNFVYK